MSEINIIRAWKDEEYRLSLSPAERASLPAHPAGLIELQTAELDAVAGGAIDMHRQMSIDYFRNIRIQQLNLQRQRRR